MSHHLDSPASRQDPRLNITDLYTFDGDTGVAFVLAVNSSLAGGGRVPGFHPSARYEIKVCLDEADSEDITYRFSFGDADGDGRQPLVAELLTGPDAASDVAQGTTVAGGRTGDVVEGAAGGLRLWAGAAADPFYLDLHDGTAGPTSSRMASWR